MSYRSVVTQENPYGLTDREIEILEMAARGASSADIRSRTCIADNTLRAHFAKIYRRMDITNGNRRVTAVNKFRKHYPVEMPQAHVYDGLTPRESQVGALLGRGHTNREIAGELKISPSTVQSYITSIESKLGIEGGNKHHIRLMASMALSYL